MKLSLKINLLFTLIVSGILLVMSVIIYNISRQNVRREFEQRLENRAARTAYLYTVFRNDTTNLLKSLDANAPPQLFNKSIIVYNLQHRVLYEFHDLPNAAFRPDTSLLTTMKPGTTYFFMKDGKEACIYYREADQDDFLVVVAADNVSGKEYINDLKKHFSRVPPRRCIVYTYCWIPVFP